MTRESESDEQASTNAEKAEELFAAYLDQLERGTAPDFTQLLAAHPYADELIICLEKYCSGHFSSNFE